MGAQSLLKFEESLSNQKGNMPQRTQAPRASFLHTPPTVTCRAPPGSARKQGPKGSSDGWPGPLCQLGVASASLSAGSGLSSLRWPELPGQGWHLEDPVLEHKIL